MLEKVRELSELKNYIDYVDDSQSYVVIVEYGTDFNNLYYSSMVLR